ncbi:MAG: thiamine pyrophosphate-dependent enzyme [Candidatus Latescibacteria bacterium]|jgi:indolepyruvate ferredoxin oxidoreductase alpha subunit|nr:thiamine pyrophosphate-dependent enzyme [Candidatus Latescibacterota bacterium]
MTVEEANGDRGLAWGALEAGVSVVTGYPGSPGTGIFEVLAEAADRYGHAAEWCLNEKIALDVAAGASQGGRRAIVCMKSVGINVALDTLMVLNMTGVHGGLVILMGDDPGAWGSQNEQDTRPLGPLSELPMLEPSTPLEGRRMVRWAFDLSEELRTVVIIRITRSFCAHRQAQDPPPAPDERPSMAPDREPGRWISSLSNTVPNHRRLHQTLEEVRTRFEAAPFSEVHGSGRLGLLAGGFAATKLSEALAGADASALTVLRLGTLYPLPGERIGRFLEGCDEVVVFEEVDPYLEDAIKAIGYDRGTTPRIRGKRSGDVNWEGELFRWHIQAALDAHLPGFEPSRRYTEADWAQEKPYRVSHCAGCPYARILTVLREEANALGLNPFLAADPGCVVVAADQLDTKLCMGSSLGVARGLELAGVPERPVAIIGDSSFYHSSINALIHARTTGAHLLLVVLDNGGAMTTGGQGTPDRAPSADAGPVAGIRDLAAACGVSSIWTVDDEDAEPQMRSTFRKALGDGGLGMLLVRKSCRPAG